MSSNNSFLFSALLAALTGVASVFAAEFEVLDRFSVDGHTVLKGSADIPGGSFTVGVSTLVVKGGNIGIGTAGPMAKLELAAGADNEHIRINNNDGTGIYYQSGASYNYPVVSYHAWKDNELQNITGQIKFVDRPGTSGYPNTVRTSDIVFQTAHNWNGVSFGQYLDDTLAISANQNGGNVGIGRTNPVQKLDVYGNIRAASTDGPVYLVVDGIHDDYNYSSLQLWGGAANSWSLGHRYDQDHSFAIEEYIAPSDYSKRFVIKTGGNVGIGTANPGAALEITGQGLIRSSSNATLRLNRNGGWAAVPSYIQWETDAAATDMWKLGMQANSTNNMYLMYNSGNIMTMLANGNVGIGATAPARKLVVDGPGFLLNGNNAAGTEYEDWPESSLSIRRSDDFVNNGITMASFGYRSDPNYFTDNSVANIRIWTESGVGSVATSTNSTILRMSSPGPLSLGTGGTADRVYISSSGNVGVGTINPVANFDVGGTGSIKIPVGTTAERPAIPANGMLRVNTTTGKLEYYNNGGWTSIGSISATGGTVTEAGGYRIHTFTSNGTFTVTSGGNVEYLVVAGGGGGGQGYQAGGGGAGGYKTGTLAVTAGTAITVTVGAGGAGGPSVNSATLDKGSNGFDSVFATITATGGGGGASYWNGTVGSNTRGLDGGSGGGAGNTDGGADAGGSGISGQGNAGGSAPGYASPFSGGGGGAGGAGANGGGAEAYGNGGAGITSAISGASVGYAGGGGGGTYYAGLTTATHGGGIGGRGDPAALPVAGTANTGGGGGGGGGTWNAGAAGGSGIVIIRYPL